MPKLNNWFVYNPKYEFLKLKISKHHVHTESIDSIDSDKTGVLWYSFYKQILYSDKFIDVYNGYRSMFLSGTFISFITSCGTEYGSYHDNSYDFLLSKTEGVKDISNLNIIRVSNCAVEWGYGRTAIKSGGNLNGSNMESSYRWL